MKIEECSQIRCSAAAGCFHFPRTSDSKVRTPRSELKATAALAANEKIDRPHYSLRTSDSNVRPTRSELKATAALAADEKIDRPHYSTHEPF